MSGRGFEVLCRWVLENAPEYAAKVDKVWLWDEWPGREGRRDAGIDLVARDRDGGLWAVQAKHYDAVYAIKKADLDSFLAESSRAEFTYRLLMATTDHLGPTARRTVEGQEKPVGTLLRSDLAALDLPWPRSLAALRPARPKRKRPRPYQRRAVKDILNGLETTERGQVLMACGTGKTLVARFLHDQIGSRRTLVLVPSLSLLKQTLREWLAVEPFDYLAVCSDETVAADEHDAVTVSTSELAVPVTTDPGEIASFLRRRTPGVVFATYQSSQRMAEAQQGRVPPFDLAICDEAHRCTGPLAGLFTTILDPRKIKARRRIFMTATPRYFTGRVKKKAKESDWEVASMDDEERFGPVLHRLSFAQAIQQDLLSDYQVVVVGVTDSDAHDLAVRGAFVVREGKPITDARTLARQIGLLRAMAKHDLHRVVSFHSRIDRASTFASSLLDTNSWLPMRRRVSGEIWAEHVSGVMTSGEREVKLNRLRSVTGGERGILANARCLSEGVDVPTLDGVAFIDPRRSQVDVVQAVGRAIRRAEDKTLGTIVIPVLVANEEDPDAALASSEFDRVWEVVRALRDHDEDLAEELDGLRRDLGRRGSIGPRPSKIVLDLPVHVGATFAKAFDTRIVEEGSENWEFMLGLLLRFVERHGHARVQRTQQDDGYQQLGNWVKNQRRDYRYDRLPHARIIELETIPGWSWNLHDDAWEDAFAALIKYSRREGNRRIPSTHVEDGIALARWRQQQQVAYRAGRLSTERIAALETVVGWTWAPPAFTRRDWEFGYERLLDYSTREGHADVPISHVENGFRLGSWVNKQRTWYASGRLDQDRVVRLELIEGWQWNTHDVRWEHGFEALESFVQRENHARVPSAQLESGFRLGAWVNKQRTAFSSGRLQPDRQRRLESLAGWSWRVAKPQRRMGWEHGFRMLQHYVSRNHDARVPAQHVEDDFPLGQWVTKQRAAYRGGRLADERQRRLEGLPNWTWQGKAQMWEDSFDLLTQFVAREGSTDVPSEHVEGGLKLGGWVRSQRTAYRHGRLSAARAARLEGLPGWVWDPYGDAWESSFAVLKEYVDREGTARVGRDQVESGFALGTWCRNQRGAYRRGAMRPDRATRLEALRGWTWSSRAEVPEASGT